MKQRNVRSFVLLLCLFVLVWQSCKVGTESCVVGAVEKCRCPGSDLWGESTCFFVSGITTWAPCQCAGAPTETKPEKTTEAGPSDEASRPPEPRPDVDAGLAEPRGPDADAGEKVPEVLAERQPEQAVEVTPEQPSSQVIELQGTLKGATGQPINNALVLIGGFSATTNAKGEFRRKVSTGEYTIAVSYELRWNNNRDFLQARVTLDKKRAILPTTQVLNLTLPPEATITGSVLGDGKGLAGAAVSFQGTGPFVGTGDRLTAKVFVDTQGAFRLPVFLGNFTVNATPPSKSSFGFISTTTTIAKDTRLDLSLPRLTRLVGTVRDKTNTGISGAQVSFSNWSATTDASGLFSLLALPGTHPFRVALSEKPTSRVSWRGTYETPIAYTAPSSGSHRLSVPDLVSLSVRVLGQGRSLPGAPVYIQCTPCKAPFTTSQSSGTTDNSGLFSTPLAPGNYEVTVTPVISSGYGPTKVPVSALNLRSTLTVNLPRRYKVIGKITTALNSPPTNANIRIGDDNSPIDQDGNYSVNVLAGIHEVVVSRGDTWNNGRNSYAASLKLNPQLKVTGDKTYNVTLPPLVTLSGVATIGGKGYENVYIKGSCTSPCKAPITSIRLRIYTDSAGKWSAQVYPGTYDFGLFPPNESGFLSKYIMGVQVQDGTLVNVSF